MFNLRRFFAGTLSAPSSPNVSQPVEATPPPPERPKQRVYLEGPAPPTQDRPILADGRLKVPPPRIPVSAGPFLICFDCKKPIPEELQAKYSPYCAGCTEWHAQFGEEGIECF